MTGLLTSSRFLAAWLIGLGVAHSPAWAGTSSPLRLGLPFTDNAVFQREQRLPVFGTDAPGTRVTVNFGSSSASTTADVEGNWRVNLPALEANASPQDLTVTGSATTVRTNVLVGDVWLISGQSNADFPLRLATSAQPVIASATNHSIRCLLLAESPRTDGRAWTSAEVSRLNASDYFSGSWCVDEPAKVREISAIGYFFIRELSKHQRVPLGLIDCTVGGSPAISWMPGFALSANPSFKSLSENYLASPRVPAFVRTRLLQNLALWDQAGRPVPMPEHPYKPGACWRNGLGTLAPFAVRGILWYQGETDADFGASDDYDAMSAWHTEVFCALVDGWRRAWERPGIPVYSVQLPQMNRPSWPWFRESQSECVQRVANTAMVVSYDCGEPGNVHPANKQPVAGRLARIARALSYGEDIEWSGPVLREWRVEGDHVVLSFDHSAGGLVSADGARLRMFEIAGSERQFVRAAALVVSNRVVVSAPEVPKPAAVRYAWAPCGKIDFFNSAGLPASPFRTDRWPAARKKQL